MSFVRSLLIALIAAACLVGGGPDVARAQGCGLQNPNCIVTTAPAGTSNNQAASTAFVSTSVVNLLASKNDWTALQTFIAAQTITEPGVQFGLTGACNATWLFNYTDPCGAYAQFYGPNGTGAASFQNRSSDFNPANPFSLDLITQQIYNVHDNTANTGYFGSWGSYWLTVRTATAYSVPTVMGLEATFLNSGANVQGDPYGDPDGWNTIMRLDSGLPGTSFTQNIVSSAIEVANDTSTFYTALKVNANALSPSTSGYYEAIQLASAPTGSVGPGQGIVWYGAPGTISGVVEVDTAGVMWLYGIAGVQVNQTITTAASDIPNGILYASKTTNFGTPGGASTGIFASIYGLNTVGQGTWSSQVGVYGIVSNSNTQHSQPASTASAVGIYGVGACEVTGCSATWGGVAAAYDLSGQSSPSVPLIGLEVDNYANGVGNGNRIGIQIVAGTPTGSGTLNSVDHGILFSGSGAASTGQFVNLIDGSTAKTQNGIVLNAMTITGDAWLSPGSSIDNVGNLVAATVTSTGAIIGTAVTATGALVNSGIGLIGSLTKKGTVCVSTTNEMYYSATTC